MATGRNSDLTPTLEGRLGSLAQVIPTMTASMQHSHDDSADAMEFDTPPMTMSNYGRRRSSSCNLLGTPSIAHASNSTEFDAHTLYKIKQGNMYLTSAAAAMASGRPTTFGTHGVIIDKNDVSINDIRRNGISALLHSRIPICYFLYHLLQEISSENLVGMEKVFFLGAEGFGTAEKFFFTEIEQYESFQYLTLIQQLATAQHIYNTYLLPNSHFEVNIDEKIRQAVFHALQEKRVRGCFDPAKAAVYALLESSFMRFIDTPIWCEMVEQCGEEPVWHDDKTRNAAVNILLQHIEQQHAMMYTNPHTDAPLAKKRHDQIKSMVHDFCRTVVGVEFQYYTAWSQQQEKNDLRTQVATATSTQYQLTCLPFPSQRASPSTPSPRSASQLMQALKRPRQVVEALDFFAKKKK